MNLRWIHQGDTYQLHDDSMVGHRIRQRDATLHLVGCEKNGEPAVFVCTDGVLARFLAEATEIIDLDQLN